MEESTLDALGESLAGNNEWISRGIQVQAHESIDPNSEATEVDLASTIGFPRERSGSATTTTTGVIVGEVYWFPAKYNSNDSSVRLQLQRYLTRSCQAAGFTLVVNSQTKVGKGINTGVRMSMMCARGRVARLRRTNTPPQRIRPTKKPTNPAERCKFRLNVYFSDAKRRWFFKKQGGGCSTHIGHCHLDPKQVKPSSTALDKDEYELVRQHSYMHNSDDNLGGELDGELDEEDDNDSPAAKRPYTELMPTFVNITDLVQTEDDLAFVSKEMNQIYSVMLSRKHKAGPA